MSLNFRERRGKIEIIYKLTCQNIITWTLWLIHLITIGVIEESRRFFVTLINDYFKIINNNWLNHVRSFVRVNDIHWHLWSYSSLHGNPLILKGMCNFSVFWDSNLTVSLRFKFNGLRFKFNGFYDSNLTVSWDSNSTVSWDSNLMFF